VRVGGDGVTNSGAHHMSHHDFFGRERNARFAQALAPQGGTAGLGRGGRGGRETIGLQKPNERKVEERER